MLMTLPSWHNTESVSGIDKSMKQRVIMVAKEGEDEVTLSV
jgi:hypothetical protein